MGTDSHRSSRYDALKGSKTEYKNYVIKNEAYKFSGDVYGYHVSMTSNNDGANVLMVRSNHFPRTWKITTVEGKYKKIQVTVGGFQKWRLMEQFRANYVPENVSLRVDVGGYNQQWELIGFGNPESTDYRKGFYGILVNRHSGLMLQAGPSQDTQGNPIDNVWVQSPYKGSQAETSINNGNLNNIARELIWEIYRIPE